MPFGTSPMICPACSEERDPIGVDIAPPLAICPACETSIVLYDWLAGSAPRVAKSSDTAVLTPEQLAQLKKLRKNTRAERAAYYAARH